MQRTISSLHFLLIVVIAVYILLTIERISSKDLIV